MAKLTINNFNGGEVSPYLYAREDVDGIYNKSCLKMENFIPLPYGGASKRPATKYLGNSHSGKVRLIPFTFSVSENYLLEFGNLYVRVWKNDSPHQNGGADILLTSPYTTADLDDIQFTQSADILFTAHKDHEPQEIKRFSDTSWSMSEVEWTFPPLLNENTDETIKITTSQKNGETVLTASQNLFNSNMVGGYFSFEAPRLSGNISLEKEFTASGISGAINVSNTNWDFETGGIWTGRITIERSLDGGVSYSTYITVCDTTSIDSTDGAKNFSVSSPTIEGNNTFLRVQYEKGTSNTGDCQISLIPTSTTVNSLVRITSYNSATSVVGAVISDFQDSIGDYTTSWASGTAFSVDDKVLIQGGLEYASVSKDLSAFSGILATVDTVSAANSSRIAGTYDFVDGTTNGISSQVSSSDSSAGPGSGARIRVVVDGSGAATVTPLGVSGKNYVASLGVNNQFTITDAALGGGGAPNLTFNVASVATSGGLDNMRGGVYGDSKYFAIDNARKVHVFTKDSSDNFMPFDQWTATNLDSSSNTSLDLTYYSNHIYVLGGITAKTETFYNAGSATTGFERLKVFKYDLDGSNAAEFLSDEAVPIGGSTANSTFKDITIPRGIGVLNGKFYISCVMTAQKFFSLKMRRDLYFNTKVAIRKYGSTGSFETETQLFSQSFSYRYGIPSGTVTNPEGVSGTPNITDITGISDASVNQLYCIDKENNKISFFTPTFISAGSFILTGQFPTSTVTASFYDDTTDGSELFWVSDTTGATKKYSFVTTSKYYQCLLAVASSDGDDFNSQLSDGHWYEVQPKMNRWSEGAFSNYRGFPDTLTFFENRLIYAGTPTKPNTLWLSEIDNFFNFKTATLDTSPMRITIASGQLDGIQWLVPHRQLIIGTSGSEWSLGAESDNKPVTPTSFDIKRKTTYGSSSIAGLLVNSAVLFFMRQGKKLREWIFNFDSQDYVAPDLTLVAEHISGTGFKTIALQQQPDNIVWTINSNDELVGMTYERDQKVIGWHRHKCTGAFESVMVLPNASSADSVYVSIKVTVPTIRNDSVINENTEVNNDRTEVRYICKLDDREWGTNYTTQYNGLDYYKVATNVSTGTISGYNYGIGETYTIVANGNTTLSGVVDSDGDLNIGTATKLVISSASLEASHLVLNFSEPHGLAVGDTINVSGLSTGSTDPNGKYLLEDGSITDADTITTDLTGSNQSYTTSGSSKVTAYILSAIRNDSVINEDTEVNNDRLGPFARLVIGKLYTGTLAPLYLNYQSRNGSTGGSKLNASKATLRFKDTVTAKVGQTELSSDLQIVKFKKPENIRNDSVINEDTEVNNDREEMVSETAEAYMSNAPEYLQTVYVVSDEPQPCTVLSMTPHVDTGSIR